MRQEIAEADLPYTFDAYARFMCEIDGDYCVLTKEEDER